MIPQPFSAMSKPIQPSPLTTTLLTVFLRLRHLRLNIDSHPESHDPISSFLALILATVGKQPVANSLDNRLTTL